MAGEPGRENDPKKARAGRAGGLATLGKYGRVFFQDIGKKGGVTLHQRYQLVPVGRNDFALVHRETGHTRALLSGRKINSV
jgi:general stress protein YciG